MQNYLVFDTESYAIDGAASYMEPSQAPANYKDPAKIAEYIAQSNAEQLAKAALDVDLARIVAIGMNDGESTHVCLAKNEHEEAAILTAFWAKVNAEPRPLLVGYNCLNFDLPLLTRRSLYLGVKVPRLQISRYRHDGIADMMQVLSFDGMLRYRGLQFFKKRFALDVPDDPYSGSGIAALVAAGDWDAVSAHCRLDTLTHAALAKRIGVIS